MVRTCRLAAVGAALVLGSGVWGAAGPTAARAGVVVTEASADNDVPLTLQNGWQSYNPGEQVAVRFNRGLVEFRGSVQGGTAAVIATLPVGFRATKTVYLRADLSGGAKGRLIISPSGEVSVAALGSFSDAVALTSLDGVSFLRGGGTALTLQNGWNSGPYRTAAPAARVIRGVVHLRGAIRKRSATSPQFTTLPVALRPSGTVYVPIDLCDAAVGRLIILSSGAVSVQAAGTFDDARCFTSLDGARFVLNPTTAPLTLTGDWTGSPYGTRTPRASLVDGRVYLSGGLAGGTTAVATTLPVGLRPSTTMWLDADGWAASKARVVVSPNGTVSVSNASASVSLLVSLEGVSFPLPSV